MTILRHPKRARGAVALFALTLAAAGAANAEPPLAPARQYMVRGEGHGTVAGPHCCGDTRFTGRFEASYTVDDAGVARLGGLRIAFHDADVVVHDGFLGLFSSRASLRCASARSDTEATGWLDGPNRIKFPAGAVSFAGVSSEGRHPDGTCHDPTIAFSGASNAPAAVTHDPVGDRFALEGTFATTIEGDAYALRLRLDGSYANRPPVADFVLRPHGDPWPQSGCPTVPYWNGQQWETVAEANDPSGLVGDLRSISGDVDGSAWREGDVFAERWFHARGSAPREFLGQSRSLEGRTFGWGVSHRVELLAVDHAGAASAASCAFRVFDTRPPVVTAPRPLTVGCSAPGGATAATSPALASFLRGGTAVDRVDPFPARLAPTLAGAPVTDTTLFPADNRARPVTFSFGDRHGNVGRASARVLVKDATAPTVTAAASPKRLPADLTWRAVRTTITAGDNCGGVVSLRLVSINSGAPELDASDVWGAGYGTADVDYYLFTRPGAGDSRLWTITYEAKDAAGNGSLVATHVLVQ
jgi:hypothetical protein